MELKIVIATLYCNIVYGSKIKKYYILQNKK